MIAINPNVETIMADYIKAIEAHLKKIDEIEYPKFIHELTNIHNEYRDRLISECRNVVKQVYGIIGEHFKH